MPLALYIKSQIELQDPFLYLLLPIFLYILYLVFKRVYLPRIHGALGEYAVSRVLKRLNKKDYVVYNDIYLKNNGRTSQIDHLILSIYGIFVIETKNYKGWIFGNEKSKYWTQTLYKRKHKIYNPIIQNWSHINFLKALSWEFKSLNYFPIVVFAGPAKLKKIEASTPVIKKRKLLRTIKRRNQVYNTHLQLAKIDLIIRDAIVSGKSIRKEHKKSVKKTIKKTRKNNQTNICPKCGGKLAIRDGKYGRFQGCMNYPKCKFTKNIK